MRKIVERQSLQDVIDHLEGCRALVRALCENAEITVTSEDALCGIAYMLEAVCKDFQANIDSAEDYLEPA